MGRDGGVRVGLDSDGGGVPVVSTGHHARHCPALDEVSGRLSFFAALFINTHPEKLGGILRREREDDF